MSFELGAGFVLGVFLGFILGALSVNWYNKGFRYDEKDMQSDG